MANRKKVFSKDDILRAMRHTNSVRAAAKYLNSDYQLVRRFFKLYTDETGKTLFEVHKNQQGKGTRKGFAVNTKRPILEDLLLKNNYVNYKQFSISALRDQLIIEGYLADECCICGFNERRVSDYKIPLLLNFKDKNQNRFELDNLELLCYNCYFLRVGNIFNNEQINRLKYQNDINSKKDINIQEITDNMKLLGIVV